MMSGFKARFMRSVQSIFATISSVFRRPKDLWRFNEAEYLRLNPDVELAIRSGDVRSAWVHWVQHGVRESRRYSCIYNSNELPVDFDGVVYVGSYPDVQPALKSLNISAEDHWVLHGRREGRRLWALTPRSKLPEDFDERLFLESNPEANKDVANFRFASGASFWLWHDQNHQARPAQPGAELTPEEALAYGFDAASYAAKYPDVWRSIGNEHDQLASHWLTTGFKDNRIPIGLNPYAGRKRISHISHPPLRIGLFGFFSEPSGIGSASRNYLDGFIQSGFATVPIDIRTGEVFETIPDVRIGNALPDYDLGIFVLNADIVNRFFLDGRLHLLDGRKNIAIWFWELSEFPDDFAVSAMAFDEIWVASHFCQKAISARLGVPVFTVPMLITSKRFEPIIAARDHFEIDKNAFVFGCIFDIGSVIKRKNPLDAIEAFRLCFQNRKDVLLILKFHGRSHYPEAAAELDQAVRDCNNIICIEKIFDDTEMNLFRTLVDCLISAHRSEGFGLNLAEFMSLGKTVIATSYGGCEDFIDTSNSYPISYSLVKVGPGSGPYDPEAMWAAPDTDHLKKLLLEVLQGEQQRAVRGAAAAETINRLYGIEKVRQALQARL